MEIEYVIQNTDSSYLQVECKQTAQALSDILSYTSRSHFRV